MMKQILVVTLLIFSFQFAVSQPSPHGTIQISCENCHATDSWKMRSDAQFVHSSTGFELTGAHKLIECRGCHEDLKFTGVRGTCNFCHADVHKGELGQECLRCHTTQTWKITDMIQRHQQTRFSLIGPHATAPCQSCHAQNATQQYTGTPTTCLGCHRKDYQNSQNPNHLLAGFSTDCMLCHRISGPTWGGGFDHQLTVFPLTGAHRAVQCTKCHTTPSFKSTTQDCYICHLADYNAVKSPNHAVGQFPHQCTNCHTTVVWKPSQFNHDNTSFALVGVHRTVTCDQCHLNGQYTGLHQNCIDCHRTDYNNVQNPNHAAGGFSINCTTCHTMNGWKPATFDHSTTKFMLTGKHTTIQCQDCHTNGNYQLAYTGCYQCHQANFTQTVNPNHTAGNFSHICETCHSTIAWSPATFDHSTTKFVLTGTHITTSCVSCHVNNNYRLSFTDCYMCHQSDFQKPTNPNHVAGNFAHTCDQCHTTTIWTPSTFNHNNTLFPLAGAHQAVLCSNCHVNNVFAGLHQNCVDCHLTDYNGATNPNHATGGFSTDCTTCHTVNAWQPATFDHSKTKFALTGAHTSVQCQTCHTNGNYHLVYTNCVQCHQADYNGAINPNHVTGGFSTDCTTCHTLNAWQPATFDHSKTKFALTGAHTSVQCQTCHTNGNYQLVYTNCYQCHATDFKNAISPVPHTGFPIDCSTCHTTNSGWTPSTYNHANAVPRFPQDTRHKSAACTKCHQNATNYTIPCCLSSGCHNSCAGGD